MIRSCQKLTESDKITKNKGLTIDLVRSGRAAIGGGGGSSSCSLPVPVPVPVPVDGMVPPSVSGVLELVGLDDDG